MAFILSNSVFTYLALFSFLSTSCYCFNPKLLNVTELHSTGSDWSTARASWYGNPSGAGSDDNLPQILARTIGGACGYQNAVESAPFYSLITAAASSIYSSGKACGVCYQVKCSTRAVCSGDPVTVVVTDECPGCDSQSIAFDLSGTSFGTMARSGESNQLRNVGIEQIQYRRVDCNFPGVSVVFRVDPGSNGYYFATAVEYENGDGLNGVQLIDSRGTVLSMVQSWGAVWKVDAPSGLKPPFSIGLTDNEGKKVVARNVIPSNYSPGQTYRSVVNL